MRGRRKIRWHWTWVLRTVDQRCAAALVIAAWIAVVGWVAVKRQAPLVNVASGQAPRGDTPAFQVDANQAPWTEWALLPGVGEGLARRIVEHRERSGGFEDIDDLRRVRGIGPKTWERLRPHVYVNAPRSRKLASGESSSGVGR